MTWTVTWKMTWTMNRAAGMMMSIRLTMRMRLSHVLFTGNGTSITETPNLKQTECLCPLCPYGLGISNNIMQKGEV